MADQRDQVIDQIDAALDGAGITLIRVNQHGERLRGTVFTDELLALVLPLIRQQTAEETARRFEGISVDPTAWIYITEAASLARESTCPACGALDNPQCQRSWHFARAARPLDTANTEETRS